MIPIYTPYNFATIPVKNDAECMDMDMYIALFVWPIEYAEQSSA